MQDRDKLTKNRTEQALCNRPTYIMPTVQHKQRKSLKGELKGKLKWVMGKRWGEVLTVDGQVLRGDFYIRAHKSTGCW